MARLEYCRVSAFKAVPIVLYQSMLCRSSGFKRQLLRPNSAELRAPKCLSLLDQGRINFTVPCSTIFAMMCWMQMTGLPTTMGYLNPRNVRTILEERLLVQLLRTERFFSFPTRDFDSGFRKWPNRRCPLLVQECRRSQRSSPISMHSQYPVRTRRTTMASHPLMRAIRIVPP